MSIHTDYKERAGSWYRYNCRIYTHIHLASVFITYLFLFAIIQSCGSIAAYTYKNEPLEKTQQIDATPAKSRDQYFKSKFTAPNTKPGKPFVGIALSGGGSRAANFSAATMLELGKLGFLQDVTAISSVSGGSLAAGYYGLFYNDPAQWNEKTVREKFGTDFEAWLLFKLFLPHNFVRYILTDYDRSDIMAGIYDDFLFNGHKIKDLKQNVLFNSTTDPFALRWQQFVFDEYTFKTELNSRIDSYPVSYAAAASAAFPGAFNDVTLRIYNESIHDKQMEEEPKYIHVFDGGIIDNLGVQTIFYQYEIFKHFNSCQKCFIFVVDAEVDSTVREAVINSKKRDLRSGFGYLVDSNAFSATDVFLKNAQEPYRKTMSLDKNQSPLHIDPNTGCFVWHISLDRLEQMILRNPKNPDLVTKNLMWPAVSLISTRLKLKGPEDLSEKQIQDLLFEGAHRLVYEDWERPMMYACQWFIDNGYTDMPCEKYLYSDDNSNYLIRTAIKDIDLEASSTKSELVDLGVCSIKFNDSEWNVFEYRTSLNNNAYYINPDSGSSFSFKVEELSQYLSPFKAGPEPTRDWVPVVDKIQGEAERSKTFLNQLIDYSLRKETKEIEDSLLFWHGTSASNYKSGKLNHVALFPIVQPFEVKTQKIGSHEFTFTEIKTEYILNERPSKLMTGIWIIELPRQNPSNENRKYFIGVYNIPSSVSLEKKDEIRDKFIKILGTIE